MKNTLPAKIIALSVLLFLTLNIYGQNEPKQNEPKQSEPKQSERKSENEPKGVFAPLIDAATSRPITPKQTPAEKAAPESKETPQPTPEAQTAARKRTVEDAATAPTQPNQQVPVAPNYPSSQGQYPPSYPYPQAQYPQVQYPPDYEPALPPGAAEFMFEQQRQMEEMKRRGIKTPNKSSEQLLKEYEDFVQRQGAQPGATGETYNNQQPIPKIPDFAAQQAADQKKLEEEQKTLIAQNSWKAPFTWLILLFEIVLTAGLSVVAFKTGYGRKSAKVMLVALAVIAVVVLLIRVFAMTQGGLEQNPSAVVIGGFAGLTFAMIASYVFVGGKIGTIINLCMMPSQTWQRLCAVFSVGIGYAAFYGWLSGFMHNTGSNYEGIVWFASIQGVVTGLAVTLIGLIVGLVRSGKSNKDDFHGSARFAERKELKEFEKSLEPGGFVLAPAHPEGRHGKLVLPRSLAVMHGLILGGSGTGKSRGYFMANCAEAQNTSLVVTDPKSELWKYTSGFQEKAMRFAPTEPEASFCFNWIPLCTDARMAELCARAIMTAGSTKNTDQFWIDAETAFLSAVFAHAAMTDLPTPMTAYRLFTRQTPEELMKQLLNSPSHIAREQAIIFNQTDARIKGAIVPAIAARMQFMRDGAIQLFTSASTEAPNFGQLRYSPTAVYWCLREQDIVRLRPLTSLFFTVLLEQLAGEQVPEGTGEVPVVAFLDEFANIGKIPDFETTISLARGRGVSLWLGVQSLSQINQTYGDHAAQTIMSNCATKLALHGLDYQTAEYVSRMLGEKTVAHTRNSFNVGLTGFSVGSSGAEHRRQLLTPDEVMRIGENEALARTSNKYPMRLYKGYYNEPPKTAPVTQTLTQIQAQDVGAEEALTL